MEVVWPSKTAKCIGFLYARRWGPGIWCVNIFTLCAQGFFTSHKSSDFKTVKSSDFDGLLTQDYGQTTGQNLIKFQNIIESDLIYKHAATNAFGGLLKVKPPPFE